MFTLQPISTSSSLTFRPISQILHRDRPSPPPWLPSRLATTTTSSSVGDRHSLPFMLPSSMAVSAPGPHYSLVCWRPPPSQSLHFLRPNPDLVSSSSPQIW